MKIAVVGAGALGLYYGAMLQRAGNEVRFLLRRDYEAVTARGLTVYSPGGDFHLEQVAGFRSAAEIGTVDLVLVGLKAFANGHFAELIGPLVGAGTQVLTLQNGLGNEEALAALFGPERVLGGVAFLCSNRGEPGVVHHLGAGRIQVGALLPQRQSAAARIAELFSTAGVECTAVPDLKRARWEKLVWNIPFNGSCALTLQPVDLLLANPRSRQVIRDMMLEVIAAANGQGLQSTIPDDFAGRMITFSDGMGPYRPSMMIDREEGRPLEIEAIFHRPLEAGRSAGVALPRIATLAALLECAVAG